MNKRAVITLSMFLLSSMAQAQTTIEISKITCDQYNLFKIADPQKIAIWLSGYYHGMQKNTSLDVSLLEEHAKTMTDYCYDNPKVYVMDAIEKLFKRSNVK